MSDEDDKPRIDLGYPLAQLAKALAGVGEKAQARVRQWQQVLAGIGGGTLAIGARTPVAKAPAWVTLEVAHGGFATGSFAGGGPMQPHELEKVAEVSRPGAVPDRAALNLYFAGDAGRVELATRLREGLYRVQVPEEAALMVMTWLLARGESVRAELLIETISPFMDQLRFYPVPHPRPLRSGTGLHAGTAGEATRSILAQRPQEQVARMKEAIQVWAPLYDRTVALFLETVDDGWPCRKFVPDWNVRAQQVLEDYRSARVEHPLCKKPDRPKENFARLRGFLTICIDDRASLTKGNEAAIRQILASYVTRHGAPGSERLQETRAGQDGNAALPSHQDLASVLARRLAHHPEDEGVPDLRKYLDGLSPEEAAPIKAPLGATLPSSLLRKAMRCLEAPLETLVAEQVVRSDEAIARALPLLTARVRASAIADPELRRLHEAVYLAFSRRRSLLLLDLQSQVKMGELPWIEAISPWTGGDDESRRSARETLTRVTKLALESFPHTILPNKLVKELRGLAVAAGQPLPLVEELAADIFMGTFSEIFLQAAQTAARLMRGTLYERYYGLPYERVLGFEVKRRGAEPATSPQLAGLCVELAEGPRDKQRSVAHNGTVIEQGQILTTHNLAALVGGRIWQRRCARSCPTWSAGVSSGSARASRCPSMTGSPSCGW